MADITSYERILKKKQLSLKILMIAIYVIIASVWFVIAVRVTLNAAMILLAPLSVLIAVLLTWKYTCIEYEYSFVAGNFTLSKIYGKSRRKVMLEFEIKSLMEIFPYNARTEGKIKGGIFINGLPGNASPNPCVCVFENDEENKVFFVLDCDEQTAKIFKFYNPVATDRAIFDNIK